MAAPFVIQKVIFCFSFTMFCSIVKNSMKTKGQKEGGMKQAIVLLAPDRLENGTYEMNYDDSNLLDMVLGWAREREALVSLIAVAPGEAKSVVREALAMGADRAQLLCLEDVFADSMELARLLAETVLALGPYELLCAGGHSQWDGAFVMAAELLGLPGTSQVLELSEDAAGFRILRENEGAAEEVRMPSPAFVSNGWRKAAQRRITFGDIQAAMEKELRLLAIDLMGAAAGRVLASGTVVRQRRGFVAGDEQGAEAVLAEVQKNLAAVIYGG